MITDMLNSITNAKNAFQITATWEGYTATITTVKRLHDGLVITLGDYIETCYGELIRSKVIELVHIPKEKQIVIITDNGNNVDLMFPFKFIQSNSNFIT